MESSEGSIVLTDCMPISPDGKNQLRLEPLREILRKVEVTSGQPLIKVCIIPRTGYGQRKGKLVERGKLGWAFKSGNSILNLISNFPLIKENNALTSELKMKTGDIFWCSLTYENTNPAILLPVGETSEKRIETTAKWWRKWASQCEYKGMWRDNIIRSLITLRMLTFSISGALIAAATTSLPEKSGGSMNWDYRYCWPRDAALALSAFMAAGLKGEAEVFFGWLLMATNATRPRISVIYDLYGRDKLPEKILKLKGYKGAVPVRIGNQAAKTDSARCLW